MSNELVLPANCTDAQIIEQVVAYGNIGGLSQQQRTQYYLARCRVHGLDPLTQPFEYLTLQNKMVLYANKTAMEQLRRNHGINIVKLETKTEDNIITVFAYAEDKDGRKDVCTGVVSLLDKYGKPLTGDGLLNAYMKCETKAKRRVTLSMGGMGMLDETEVESIPKQEKTYHDPEHGYILSDDDGLMLQPMTPGEVSEHIYSRLDAVVLNEDYETYKKWREFNNLAISTLFRVHPELCNKIIDKSKTLKAQYE